MLYIIVSNFIGFKFRRCFTFATSQ